MLIAGNSIGQSGSQPGLGRVPGRIGTEARRRGNMEGLQPLPLSHDGDALEGYIARPDGEGPFPTVIIYHSGLGLKPFECNKAKAVAKLGYLGVVADMFGLISPVIKP